MEEIIKKLLVEDDEETLEKIWEVIYEEFVSDEEPPRKKARQILQALTSKDPDAITMAFTGWSVTTLLGKAGVKMGEKTPAESPTTNPTKRISIPFDEGSELVAELGFDPDFPEIFVTLMEKGEHPYYMQDVVLVRPHECVESLSIKRDYNRYDTIVWGNSEDEDYTDRIVLKKGRCCVPALIVSPAEAHITLNAGDTDIIAEVVSDASGRQKICIYTIKSGSGGKYVQTLATVGSCAGEGNTAEREIVVEALISDELPQYKKFLIKKFRETQEEEI